MRCFEIHDRFLTHSKTTERWYRKLLEDAGAKTEPVEATPNS
jgi:hypothetical protein